MQYTCSKTPVVARIQINKKMVVKMLTVLILGWIFPLLIAGIPSTTLAAAQGIIDRPILLDHPTMVPEVVGTLNLQEKMNLINMTYDYCNQSGNVPDDDADKCRAFMTNLDQALVDMLTGD